jgi:hypothetical protein
MMWTSDHTERNLICAELRGKQQRELVTPDVLEDLQLNNLEISSQSSSALFN